MMTPSAHTFTNYWTIGFSGHRVLKNEDEIAAIIADQLQKIRADVVGELAAISSIAVGGDTVFAEQVWNAGIKWIALLPFPEDEFKKDAKFGDEPESVWMKRWERSKESLDKAVVTDIWSPVRDEKSYKDVGINMVDECDILIAVWDGQKAKGPGGTAEIVAYARAQRIPKPVVWIHAETGKVVRKHFPERFIDETYEILSRWKPTKRKEARNAVEDFFNRVDDFASVRINKIRYLEMRVIIYNTVAAFIVGLTLAFRLTQVDWVTASLVAVGFGFFAALLLQWSYQKEIALQARLLAEFCRSLLATWDFPERLTDLYRGNVPQLQHLMRSLLWNRDIERNNREVKTNTPPATAAGKDLTAFTTHYIADRLENPKTGQINYYRKQWRKSAPKVFWYGRAAFVASATAVVAALTLEFLDLPANYNPFPAISNLIVDTGKAEVPHEFPWLDCLGIAAPLVASVFTALVTVNEHKRRAARYQEMEQFLEDAKLRLSNVLTHRAIRRVIIETETALLGENYQWYYYAIDNAAGG
jgi:hypothetical protein